MLKFSWMASVAAMSNPPGANVPAGHACSASLPVPPAAPAPLKSVSTDKKAAKRRLVESYFASLGRQEKGAMPRTVRRAEKVVLPAVMPERIGARALRLMAEAKGAPSETSYGMPPGGIAARALRAAGMVEAGSAHSVIARGAGK